MGRNLHHAVRPERRVSQLARLLWIGRERRLATPRSTPTSNEPEPARRPALLFRGWLAAAVCALAIEGAVAPVCAAEVPATEFSPPASAMNAEEACATIRRALNDLAEAEHAQAFALDLVPAQDGSTAMIETRLSALLDRTSQLREALRNVRRGAVARDPSVEQCAKIGLRALVEAEKLTTSVEEVLYGRDLEDASTAAPVRSDAAPAVPAALP